MPEFEDSELFMIWWNSFPHNVDSFSREAIAYEAWKAAKKHYRRISTAFKCGEDFNNIS